MVKKGTKVTDILHEGLRTFTRYYLSPWLVCISEQNVFSMRYDLWLKKSWSKHNNWAGQTSRRFRDKDCNRFCYDAKNTHDAERRIWYTRVISVFTEHSHEFKSRGNHTTHAQEPLCYAWHFRRTCQCCPVAPQWVTIHGGSLANLTPDQHGRSTGQSGNPFCSFAFTCLNTLLRRSNK